MGKMIEKVAFGLMVVGGVALSLAIWDINVVSGVFGSGIMSNLVYGAIGVSAVYSGAKAITKK